MANEVIVGYLRDNLDKFPIESLKEKILGQGYSEADYTEALRVVHEEQNKVNQGSFHMEVPGLDLSEIDEPSVGVVPNKEISQDSKPLNSFSGTGNNLNNNGGRGNFLQIAAISGFILAVFSAINFILGFIGNERLGLIFFNLGMIPSFAIIIILALIIISCSFVYFIGFVKLGKILESKLMRISSIASVVLLGLIVLIFIISVVLAVSSVSSLMSGMAISGAGDFGATEIDGARISGGGIIPDRNSVGSSSFSFNTFTIIGMGVLFLLLAFFVSRVVFSISLLKVGKKIRFSKFAGILGLVTMSLVFLGLGFSIYGFFNPGYLRGDTFEIYSLVYNSVLSILVIILLVLESLVLIEGHRNFKI